MDHCNSVMVMSCTALPIPFGVRAETIADNTSIRVLWQWSCGTYVDEGRLDTDGQEYTLDGLQEGTNYSFTVNQTGFSRGRVLYTGPVYARTFTTGNQY